MTRTKIQMMKFFVFLLIFLLEQSAVCDGSFRINRDAPELTSINKSVNETAKKLTAHILSDGQKTQPQNAVLPGGTTSVPEDAKTMEDGTSKPSVNVNKTGNTTDSRKEHAIEGRMNPLNIGALKRGLYVFVGLSVLVMAYVVFRSLRLSKTRAQMVRKYGVLAHRQDVEMRPLPLDEEDDEDTTVFDASNVLTNNVQHQNL
ncbi:uncharacterized protein LOC143188242 [Calliopsis andreniformis]|uniref:uncharacterized protein LOC143188242 n=1 Tax=Calliopsis andreniformis TaxID=337506 RepID=UPI003FCEA0AC